MLSARIPETVAEQRGLASQSSKITVLALQQDNPHSNSVYKWSCSPTLNLEKELNDVSFFDTSE